MIIIENVDATLTPRTMETTPYLTCLFQLFPSDVKTVLAEFLPYYKYPSYQQIPGLEFLKKYAGWSHATITEDIANKNALDCLQHDDLRLLSSVEIHYEYRLKKRTLAYILCYRAIELGRHEIIERIIRYNKERASTIISEIGFRLFAIAEGVEILKTITKHIGLPTANNTYRYFERYYQIKYLVESTKTLEQKTQILEWYYNHLLQSTNDSRTFENGLLYISGPMIDPASYHIRHDDELLNLLCKGRYEGGGDDSGDKSDLLAWFLSKDISSDLKAVLIQHAQNFPKDRSRWYH